MCTILENDKIKCCQNIYVFVEFFTILENDKIKCCQNIYVCWNF